jgi:hypothetical protein
MVNTATLKIAGACFAVASIIGLIVITETIAAHSLPKWLLSSSYAERKFAEVYLGKWLRNTWQKPKKLQL